MNEKNQSSIVSKCGAILDILANSPRALSFTEISNRTGFVKSSTHRLLSILMGEGLIQQDASGKTYRLGNRVMRWGKAFVNRSVLPRLSSGYLETLSEKTRMNAALSVRDEDKILYLQTYDTFYLRFASSVGDRASLYSTAAGKVFLAHLGTEARNHLLENLTFERFTEFTIRSAIELLPELEKTKERGYGLAIQEEAFQVIGMAAPIFDTNGRVAAALSLWSLIERMRSSEIEQHSLALTQAAAELTDRLADGELVPATG